MCALSTLTRTHTHTHTGTHTHTHHTPHTHTCWSLRCSALHKRRGTCVILALRALAIILPSQLVNHPLITAQIINVHPEREKETNSKANIFQPSALYDCCPPKRASGHLWGDIGRIILEYWNGKRHSDALPHVGLS